MKKIVLLTVLLNVCGVMLCHAQKSKIPVKSIKSTTAETAVTTEISGTEWEALTVALQAEDWTKSATVAAQYLQKLKSDNGKKQLAQLRYLRLYALAGKVLAVSAAKIPANEILLWKELDDAAGEFNGREFVLPPRRYLSECESVVNYICAVKDNERALRVTATNKAGTAIHSFDYIVFDDIIALANLSEDTLFLGGFLKRIEYNQDASKPWVMRLIFEKGFVRAVGK